MAASRRLTEAGRALRHRVKHRLNVGGRATDHSQDFRGGRLLLEGRGEVGVLGLELGEEPRVLDSDGGLVGKRLHQCDLAVRKRSDLESVDMDHAEKLARPEHRNREEGAERWPHILRPVSVFRVGLDVGDMDGPALKGGARCGAVAAGRDRVLLGEPSELCGDIVDGHDSQQPSVEAVDERMLGLA